MSDERELVERLATIDATPRARWVAELRADLDAAWGSTNRGDLDSLRMTTVTLVDNEPTPSEPGDRRRWGTLIAAAAAVVLIVGVLVVFDRDDAPPADQPATTVTVPQTPPRALFDTAVDEQLAPGTYFVDEVDGTPTARIFVTIGTGWTNFDGSGLDKHGPGEPSPLTLDDDIGFITFSRPDRVYVDACNLDDGFYPGPVTTVDGFVTALREQQGGWVDVTAPLDISVDGYSGKTFQRTAPAVLSDCPMVLKGHMRDPEADGVPLRSWESSNFAGQYYEPGQFETLMVLDIDGTVVVINANLWAGSSAADRAEFADVLDSIRIWDPRPLPNVPPTGPLEPGTYYVDEVNGTPTPRIFATLDSGWSDVEATDQWYIAKGGIPDEGGIGLMTITNPVAVFSDACHPTDGFHPGSVATVDGFVTALRDQQGGWVDVTAPSDISVDGYVGKAFQRTAPAAMWNCTAWDGSPRSSDQAVFSSWESADGINGGYAPGTVETLWVLDVDGTVIVISTALWPGPSATAHADFADAVLDSIRIDRP